MQLQLEKEFTKARIPISSQVFLYSDSLVTEKELIEVTACKIRLNTLEKVKRFVNEISKSGNQYNLIYGNYCVDASSVLGILSMDLTKPLELKAKGGNAEIPENILVFVA